MPRNQKWRNNTYVRDMILRMEENKDARHSRGCAMVNSVSPVEDPEMVGSAWNVLSSSGDGSSYQVRKINENEHWCLSEKWCDIKCWSCDACRESYDCDCPDYQDNENMCKHIHAVCMFLNGYTNQENQAVANTADAVPPRETRDIETQTERPVTPSGPLPGTSRQGNSSALRPTAGNPMQEISSDLSSGSDSDSLERPQEVRRDLKSRILADANEVPQKLLVKYDQLDEPELRRVRVLLKQLRHIVRDA